MSLYFAAHIPAEVEDFRVHRWRRVSAEGKTAVPLCAPFHWHLVRHLDELDELDAPVDCLECLAR